LHYIPCNPGAPAYGCIGYSVVSSPHPSTLNVKSRARITVLLCACVFFVPSAVHADLFSPDRPLFITETDYFTLIYPQESREAAAQLASFADDTYRQVASLLGTEIRHRLPVVITPDHEVTNAYFTTYPFPRIVLYQAAIDPNSSLGSFRDDMRAVFLHELTHAVSLTIRSPLEEALVGVFGAPLGLSYFMTPMSFVEGVTVSFESLDGHGRAADPLAGAMLRQDLLEGNWKTFRQAAGAWDRYPFSTLYYIYGGYFSRYLQQRFGMEKYAALWREFGAKALFLPLDDTWLRHGRFSKIFGVSLSSAWADFRVSMMTRTPVVMAVEKLTPPSVIAALATYGTTLYYYDAPSESVRSFDTLTNKGERLFRTSSIVNRLDAARDGSRILVSTAETDKGFVHLALNEWNRETGRLRTLAPTRIRDAVYLEAFSPKDGTDDVLAGIMVDGYRTDLVVIGSNGTSVLLEGSERLSYASPTPSDDGLTLYALAREDGIVTILRISLEESGGTIRAASIERLVLPPELSWIRYLSFEKGILRFSWNDSAFYRLVELEDRELRFQSVPVSGGVHSPLAVGDKVYYLGRFSEGISLCVFPEDRGELSFGHLDAVWQDAPGLLPVTPNHQPETVLNSSAYQVARWLVPRFWLPSARVDIDGLVSAGAVVFIADPAERLDATLSAAWNFRMEATDLELALSLTQWSMPVAIRLYDTFLASADGQGTRISGVSLGVETSGSFKAGGDFSWNLGTALEGYGRSDAGDSPYAPLTIAAAAIESGIGYQDITAPLRDREKATGFASTALARFDTPVPTEAMNPIAGLEAGITGYLGPGAIKLELHGAVSVSGGLRYGPEGRVYPAGQIREGSYPLWPEFAGGSPGPWFAEGEASLRVYGTEVQKNIGSFHANRLSIRAGARGNAGIDAAWSVFSRFSLVWTPATGAFSLVHPTTYLELWARPDLMIGGYVPHGFSFMLVSSY